MADIDNPQVVNFVDKDLRPVSEKLTAIDYIIDDLLAMWNAEIDDLIDENEGTDLILTPHVDRGLPQRTKSDIIALGAVMNALKTVFDTGNNRLAVKKFNTRTLQRMLTS